MTKESRGDTSKSQSVASIFENKANDNKVALEIEVKMVQSRLLSPIIAKMEEVGMTQKELAKRSGMTQPFVNSVLNIRKKISVEHIAKFQKALGIVLQPPIALTEEEHYRAFYDPDYHAEYKKFKETIHLIASEQRLRYSTKNKPIQITLRDPKKKAQKNEKVTLKKRVYRARSTRHEEPRTHDQVSIDNQFNRLA